MPATINNLAGITPTVIINLTLYTGGRQFTLVNNLGSNLFNFSVIPISRRRHRSVCYC